MGKKIAAAVLIAILVAIQAVYGAPSYLLSREDIPLCALTYSLFHASWWHLAVNSLAIWSVMTRTGRCIPRLVVAFMIAVVVYPVSLLARPVIGFSNILFAMTGLAAPSVGSAWWRTPNAAVFAILMLLTLFIPQISAITHIASFGIGMASAACARWWKDIARDAERYLH